jgi:ATP-binding protein involved in chromosome partitioning
MNQESILNALKLVKYPGFSRDIVSFGIVKNVSVNNGAVSVMIELTSASREVAAQLKESCEQTLRALPEVKLVHVDVKLSGAAQAAPGATAGAGPWANQNKVAGINRIVAVASGKGGVGKSTCSVNVACALQHWGHRLACWIATFTGPAFP